MAGKGSPKGSNNGGGMRKGQVTKKTQARRAAEKVAGKRVAAQAVKDEKAAADAPAVAEASPKLAKEILSEAMNYFYGLAARFQPLPTNESADEKKFVAYLDKAADIASKLAPYQSPRLANTVLKGDKEAPVHHTVQVEFVDGSGNKLDQGAVTSRVRAAVAGESPV